ncbi:stage III sporulation protein AE [Clostridium hydrogeniformans]|uniref:stage III sporulation protein AE n=1 Tax=Clostridium hydrogeniformans TaxID=349933 RepID=UPI00054D77EC|nr:stage III sporulation protein AE [Clostridium hydrogeniformans]
MNIKSKILILIIVFITLFSIPAYGIEGDGKEDKTKTENSKLEEDTEKKIDGLYNYITNMKFEDELLNELNPKEFVKSYIKDGEGNISISSFKNVIKKLVFKEVIATTKLMILVIVIGTICALIKNLQSAFNNESLSNIAYFAGYALLIIVLSKSFLLALDLVKTTITDITNFMAALIPVLFMLLLSVGGITEAATMDPIVLGAVNIAPRIYIDFIIPLILMVFVLQFVNNISKDYKISKLAKLIKQVVLISQGVLMTIFIGILSIRGITATTLDAVTAKTAKFAVDNFIPIVGKALSDAIATVAGYSLILKNALSTIGFIVLLLIILVPIIKIFLMAMLYKLTGALLEPISDDRIVNCITSAGDSLILIMSCVISLSVMFFVMIAIMASAGKFIIGA